ncbi:MAG TPA: ABC transporter ATP-binding protein, partial [Acidimicrobiales bacterium]|nr:ABC transporter ATP-binding protein [Acidimicrobiales bacterium]
MLLRLLNSYLRPYRHWITAVVAMQFLQSLAALYLPSLNAAIIDNGVIRGNTGYILVHGGIMLAITIAQVACSITAVYFGASASMALGRDLRAGIFHHVQDFSAREVGHFGTPSLITRTTNDVQQIQMLALLSFTLMVSAPIMGVGSVIMALNQNVKLSSLLLVVVPVLGAVVALLVSRMRPLFRLMQRRIDRVNLVLREQISGVRVIRAFVRDDWEGERFADTNGDLFQVSLATGRLMAYMFPAVMLIVNLASIATIWFGGRLIGDGSMQVGALIAFLTYLVQVLMAVMMATFMFLLIPRAEACAERIQEVLTTEPTVLPPLKPAPLQGIRGRLELRDVDYRYPGAQDPVLRGVNLVAEPGEVTAVIGSTGSGKTTLLNLVPRLYDASAGLVLIDGHDVRDIEPEALSRLVGIVPQRPYLFSGTVVSNLRYGREDATDEELWHALEIAQARDFVENMPGMLEAEIAQGGTNVSGGQRQRLAIARALVHRPPIYLFDDSFSALDYSTDAALRAALARDVSSATVVIVAQRVSTIRHASRIVV